jgi:hypothetical protein
MKYFLDTEFHEYAKKPLLGKAINTIELISIGIVNENNQTYYAICNEFDIKQAWNNEWLRTQVITPIFYELAQEEFHNIHYKDQWIYNNNEVNYEIFSQNDTWFNNLKWFKKLLKKYGKTKAQIAKEIIEFVAYNEDEDLSPADLYKPSFEFSNIEFYAYYADYDWVVFCWLFGRMIDLPNGFPKYCLDLKQSLDSVAKKYTIFKQDETHEDILIYLKGMNIFPKQTNEHNALADAQWNKELYEFLHKV